MGNKIESNLVPQDDRNVAMNQFDLPVHFLQVRSARFLDESDETISFLGEAGVQL
jgi:hypothetical protein